MERSNETPTLFRVWDTPVRMQPAVVANLLSLWGLLSWLAGRRNPERPWPIRLLVGALSILTLLAADIGHAVAHIVSARRAGAPMDEILLTSGMPRTVYHDNDISPRAHRHRALGGPVFSGGSLLISLLLRSLAPRNTIWREQIDLSCIGHGFIFAGSLAPLPYVDGGSLLKWTLVEKGQTPDQADETVRQIDLALGASAATTGLFLAVFRRWLPSAALIAGGIVALAAALRPR